MPPIFVTSRYKASRRYAAADYATVHDTPIVLMPFAAAVFHAHACSPAVDAVTDARFTVTHVIACHATILLPRPMRAATRATPLPTRHAYA